jgi:hypothetical protein
MENENAHPTQWHRFVPAALASIRLALMANLDTSPHFLTYGADPVIPADVLVALPQRPDSIVEQDLERLRKTLENIGLKQLESHLKNKERYDQKIQKVVIQVGDFVFKHSPKDLSKSGISRKTAIYQEGPYKVDRILNDGQVEVAKQILSKQGKTTVEKEIVSRDRLTKAHPWDLTKLPAPSHGL